MAIGHISIRVHTRAKGHSAAAALGYRMGVDLVDSRTGVEHAYGRRTRRGDVLASGMAGSGVFADVAAFAAAIESAERRRNSALLRDVQVALPAELGVEESAALLQEFAEMLAERYDTHVAWAMHRADARGDVRNKHGHIVLPTRALGEDGGFGKKLRVLDDRTTGPGEVKEIRRLWEGTANTYLETEGVEERVDVGRRVEGEPMPTLGAGCTALEREEAEARGELAGRGAARRAGPQGGPAGVGPGLSQRKSMAALVTEGEPVTWRGRALQQHQWHAQREAVERARRAGEHQDQGSAAEVLLRVPCAEVEVADAARPVPVELRRERSAAAAVVPVARPDAGAQPDRIELRREVARRRGVQVGQAHPERVATPARIALGRRKTTGGTAREIRAQTVARPGKVVFARRAPSPSAPVDVRQARPSPSATPQQAAARSGPVVARPVGVRPVDEARPAAPTEQYVSALKTPPSLQELSDQLHAEVYADQDAAAAEQPADPSGSMAIGYADWGAVCDTVRDNELWRTVADGTADRANDEGRDNYDVHHTWTERIAAWIREHVAAALKLLRLRQREEAEVRKDQVRLAVHLLPTKLRQVRPYPHTTPSLRVVPVSFARLDRIAVASGDEVKQQFIAEFQKRHAHEASLLDRAEEIYLHPIIQRRHEEALATYEQAKAERGVFSRRPTEPTWAQAEAAVSEEYDTEVLGVIEEVCVYVQQRPLGAVRSELQRFEVGQAIPEQRTSSRSVPNRDGSGQERGDAGPSW